MTMTKTAAMRVADDTDADDVDNFAATMLMVTDGW